MVKVVGIVGSHRRNGATELLVREALKAAEEEGVEVEMVTLADRKIDFCKVCFDCSPEKEGECSIRDDDVPEICRKLEEADGIIVGSPVYFGLPTGKLKALMDRTIALRRAGFKLRNKVGGALAVGGHRNGGQEMTLTAIHTWMLVHDMLVVSDGKPTSHLGATGVARGREDAEKDSTGLQLARSLGKKVAEAAKQLHGKA